MKRQRPPMPPLAVRVRVAERQMHAINPILAASVKFGGIGSSLTVKLKRTLDALRASMRLLSDAQFALDHDPALILRPYNPRIKDIAARYAPHAHDPVALVYREKADHQQKTTGRKPGAERTITTKGSDVGLKAKFARLEGRVKPKRKQPIKSRGFAKGPKRKIASRGFQ